MNRLRPTSLLLLLIDPFALGGCGTMLSFLHDPEPYGGVQYDIEHGREFIGAFGGGFGSLEGVRGGNSREAAILFVLFVTRPIWCVLLLGIDIAASAVADTALLPITLMFCRPAR
jgi:uncharacterized protein YceK